PRDRLALAEDPQYNHCRKLVLDFLYNNQRHPSEDDDASPINDKHLASSDDESLEEAAA
ncbi:MAG: ABC transporter ATP-binding protein, partial [Pseudomonadota bacterium]